MTESILHPGREGPVAGAGGCWVEWGVCVGGVLAGEGAASRGRKQPVNFYLKEGSREVNTNDSPHFPFPCYLVWSPHPGQVPSLPIDTSRNTFAHPLTATVY